MVMQDYMTLATNGEYKKIITMTERKGGEWCVSVRQLGSVVGRSNEYIVCLLRALESSGLISLETRRGRNGYTKITLLHPAAKSAAGEASSASGEPAGARAAISPAEAEAILPRMRERREWLDVVRYRSGVRTYEEAEARIPEFIALMKTRVKTWARESDLIEHFANWLAKRLKADRPRAAKRRDEAPTSTLERAYELITNPEK